MKLKEIIFKHKIVLLFIIFFLIVLFQHQFLWLYHDDYGYSALTYLGGYSPINVVGNHTLNEILDFLLFHYNNWGGRILYFFIECISLEIGLWFFRIIQSIVLTLIFYIIYKIISEISGKEDVKIALLSISLYGIFEIFMVRSSIFWITASVLYLFPLLPFLLFVYLYTIKNHPKRNKKLFYILNTVLVFLASFSQEQTAVMTLSFIGLITIYDLYKTKKINKIDFIMVLMSFTGFGILMLAPGNKIRMQHPTSVEFYKLNLFEKIETNIPSILLNNFGNYTRIFTVLFFMVICYISYKCLTNKYGNKLLNKISLISNSIIFSLTVIKDIGYFNYILNFNNNIYFKYVCYLIFIIQLLLIVYNVTIYLYYKNRIAIICLFYAGVLSQAAMLVAPYYPLRSALIFQFVMLIIFILIFSDFYNNLKQKNNIIYLIIPLSFITIINFYTITKGYYLNNNINKENDKILKETSEKIKAGKKIEKIELKKMKDVTYSCDQPYIEGFEYIETWIKQYYNLPNDIILNYK